MAPSSVRSLAILSALSLALLVTRFNHFGSPVNPPDATLAVLFLAGWYVGTWQSLAVLLALAGFADAISIAGGVSAWCVTPAYWFLIPAYAALWGAGRWARNVAGSFILRAGAAALAFLSGVTVFFVISNASFFLLAGYFGSMTAGDYARAVAQYFQRYLVVAAGYVAIAGVIDQGARIVVARHRASTEQRTGRHQHERR